MAAAEKMEEEWDDEVPGCRQPTNSRPLPGPSGGRLVTSPQVTTGPAARVGVIASSSSSSHLNRSSLLCLKPDLSGSIGEAQFFSRDIGDGVSNLGIIFPLFHYRF
jgi:hypothetical protein